MKSIIAFLFATLFLCSTAQALDLFPVKYVSTPASPAVAAVAAKYAYSHGNSGGVPSGKCRNGTSSILGAGTAGSDGQCVPVSIASAGGSTSVVDPGSPAKAAVAAVCTTDVIGIANPPGHPNGAHSHTGAC